MNITQITKQQQAEFAALDSTLQAYYDTVLRPKIEKEYAAKMKEAAAKIKAIESPYSQNVSGNSASMAAMEADRIKAEAWKESFDSAMALVKTDEVRGDILQFNQKYHDALTDMLGEAEYDKNLSETQRENKITQLAAELSKDKVLCSYYGMAPETWLESYKNTKTSEEKTALYKKILGVSKLAKTPLARYENAYMSQSTVYFLRRMQEIAAKHMREKVAPKTESEAVMRKALNDSLFNFALSSAQRAVNSEGIADYKFSTKQKVAAGMISFAGELPLSLTGYSPVAKAGWITVDAATRTYNEVNTQNMNARELLNSTLGGKVVQDSTPSTVAQTRTINDLNESLSFKINPKTLSTSKPKTHNQNVAEYNKEAKAIAADANRVLRQTQRILSVREKQGAPQAQARAAQEVVKKLLTGRLTYTDQKYAQQLTNAFGGDIAREIKEINARSIAHHAKNTIHKIDEVVIKPATAPKAQETTAESVSEGTKVPINQTEVQKGGNKPAPEIPIEEISSDPETQQLLAQVNDTSEVISTLLPESKPSNGALSTTQAPSGQENTTEEVEVPLTNDPETAKLLQQVESNEAAINAQLSTPTPQQQQQVQQRQPQQRQQATAATAAQFPPEVSALNVPKQNEGWGKLFDSQGMAGLSSFVGNASYVLTMIPNLLVGMMTGQLKGASLKDNIMPMAMILGAMFTKNSLLKMLLLFGGGSMLFNNASKRILGEGIIPASSTKPQYRKYEDERLNSRIENPAINGRYIVATIDGVPAVLSINKEAADAYHQGKLPLNTLCNAALENLEKQNALDNATHIDQRMVESEEVVQEQTQEQQRGMRM